MNYQQAGYELTGQLTSSDFSEHVYEVPDSIIYQLKEQDTGRVALELEISNTNREMARRPFLRAAAVQMGKEAQKFVDQREQEKRYGS